jgi:glycerophosphoryl diester phosphodiesterase
LRGSLSADGLGHVIAGAWSDGKRTWLRLLTADAIYKLAAFVILTPLVGLALNAFLSLSGRSVLADQDILFFVLSPVGLVTLIVVAAASLAILAVEQATLMTLCFGAARGARVSAGAALSVGVRHLGSILRITRRMVTRGLLLAAPFLAAGGLVYGLLLREHDINFYLSNRPPEFWIAAALIGSILLGLAFVLVPRLLGWAYALPLHLFEDVPASEALAESRRRTSGHRSIVAYMLVAWAVVSALASTLGLGFITSLGRFLVPRAQGSMNLLLFVMGGLLLLWSAGNLLFTLFQTTSFALLVVRLYDRYGKTEAAELPTEASEDPARGRRGGFPLKAVLLGLLAAAVVAGVLGYILVRIARTEDDVIVIAHRGAAGRAPENTLASFAAAMDDGADLVELDVQETRDGEVVVIHDSDFMKIAGESAKVWEGDLERLRQFDIGSWFSPDFSSERLPTLEEVLSLAKSRGKRLDIELKYYGHNERLEERVVELVEKTGMSASIVIMSLAPDMVRKVRELRPGWTVGLLTATAVGDLVSADADFLAVHTAMASRRFIRRAHAAGKEVYVWTVNDPILMSRMMSRGVDGVITDEPALARAVIARRAELSSIERLLLLASYWLGAEIRELPPSTDAP